MGKNRFAIVSAMVEELEAEYNKALDALIVDNSEANISRERTLLQKLTKYKRELESLKAEKGTYTDEELEEIANGVLSDKQELTEVEDKLFDAIADSF